MLWGLYRDPYIYFPSFLTIKQPNTWGASGIYPEDFNDDKIGRVLDKLYEFGLSKIFLAITISAFKKYNIYNIYSHLDSSSISVHGDYDFSQNKENSEPRPIQITHGYSKDKRPDLKQFLINLIVSGDSGIPLFLECGNGNDSDRAKESSTYI